MSHTKTTSHLIWLKRFADNNPILFSILVILMSGLLTEIPFGKLFIAWTGEPGDKLLTVLINHTLTGVLLIWLLIKLDLFQYAGFTSIKQWKAVWLVWPFALFILLNLDSVLSGHLVIDTSRPDLIILYIFRNFAIGFCEEVMARSVVLMVILRKWGDTRRGVYKAVLVSSILFGIAHIFNFLTGRIFLVPCLTQITYSFVFGVAFSACFLRNNAIWPVMLMHALIDMAGGLRHISVGGASQAPVTNTTMTQIVTTLVLSVPLLLYGLFIMRKVPPWQNMAVEK